MQSDDELNSIIDRALSSYSDVQPLAGLEERVLNRIRASESARRSFGPLRWALALSFILVLAAAIAVRTQYRPASDMALDDASRRPIAISPLDEVTPSHSPIPGKLEQVTRRRHEHTLKPLPKREQFPAAAPITDQERALLTLVERNPVEALNLFADLKRQVSEPIEIEPLQIKPLQGDDAQ